MSRKIGLIAHVMLLSTASIVMAQNSMATYSQRISPQSRNPVPIPNTRHLPVQERFKFDTTLPAQVTRLPGTQEEIAPSPPKTESSSYARPSVPAQAIQPGVAQRSEIVRLPASDPRANAAGMGRSIPAPDASRVIQASQQETLPRPIEDVQVEPIPAPSEEGGMANYATGGTYSLEQLVSIAVSRNPILERSESEIEAAMGERVQAALYPNPRFETNNPEIWAGQQSYYNFGWQQDLVTKGKIRLDKAAADQLIRSEAANYNVDRAQMLTEIRKQYVKCVAMRQRVVLAEYLAKVSQKSVNVAKQLQDAGEGSQTDVLLLESEFQRSMADLESARALLDGEYKQLAAVTGDPTLDITNVEGTLFHHAPEFNENAVRDFVSYNSALMERLRADIIRNQTLLRRAEVEAYPNIRFGPSFQSGTTSGQSQFWLSLVFDIPVFDLNQGNIRKAQAKVRGAYAELEVVKNEMLRITSEKFARYRAAKVVTDRISSSILPNSQRAFLLVQDGFSKGQFDVNRLLQAQRILSDVAREQIDASEQEWVGAAELGGLIQMEYFPLYPAQAQK